MLHNYCPHTIVRHFNIEPKPEANTKNVARICNLEYGPRCPGSITCSCHRMNGDAIFADLNTASFEHGQADHGEIVVQVKDAVVTKSAIQ